MTDLLRFRDDEIADTSTVTVDAFLGQTIPSPTGPKICNNSETKACFEKKSY